MREVTKVVYREDGYIDTNVLEAIESTDVQKLIGGMLKENTGAHFLDSGDFYGRHWERNQNRKFGEEPEAYWVVDSEEEFYPMISTYHALVSVLERDWEDVKIERELYKMYKEDEDLGLLAGMEEMGERMVEEMGYEEYFTVNTYNDPDHEMIDQTLQFVVVTGENRDEILLQIHGGCDVRGGYTYPRVFHVDYWGDLISALSTATATDSEGNMIRYDGYYYMETFDGEEWKSGRWKEISETVLKEWGWRGNTEKNKVYDKHGKEVVVGL